MQILDSAFCCGVLRWWNYYLWWNGSNETTVGLFSPSHIMVHKIISKSICKGFLCSNFFSLLINFFRQRENYSSGQWYPDLPVHSGNVECNFHLARILEFMECPQYLRKTLFPLQKTLKYAGKCFLNAICRTETFLSSADYY